MSGRHVFHGPPSLMVGSPSHAAVSPPAWVQRVIERKSSHPEPPQHPVDQNDVPRSAEFFGRGSMDASEGGAHYVARPVNMVEMTDLYRATRDQEKQVRQRELDLEAVANEAQRATGTGFSIFRKRAEQRRSEAHERTSDFFSGNSRDSGGFSAGSESGGQPEASVARVSSGQARRVSAETISGVRTLMEQLKLDDAALAEVSDHPRCDFLSSVRAGLEDQAGHRNLKSFPVQTIVDKLGEITAKFMNSNLNDEHFHKPLTEILLFFHDFLNSKTITALLSPFASEITTLKNRTEMHVASQEQAHRREDMAQKKAAIISQIETLRTLLQRLRDMSHVVHDSEVYNEKLAAIDELRTNVVAQLVDTKKRMEDFAAQAEADQAALDGIATEEAAKSEATKKAFEEEEQQLLDEQKLRYKEQSDIVEEISRLLKRYGELQDKNTEVSAQMQQNTREEEKRRTEHAYKVSRIENRASVLRNASLNFRLATELNDDVQEVVDTWCKGVSSAVASKKLEVSQAARDVHLEQATAYTEFFLVTKRLLQVLQDRQLKLTRNLEHYRAEKEMALRLLNQEDVDKWSEEIRRAEHERRVAIQEAEELEQELNEEKTHFAAVEREFERLGMAYDPPENAWADAEEALRVKLYQDEKRRFDAWQGAMMGLLGTAARADQLLSNAPFVGFGSSQPGVLELADSVATASPPASVNTSPSRRKSSPAAAASSPPPGDDEDADNGDGSDE